MCGCSDVFKMTKKGREKVILHSNDNLGLHFIDTTKYDKNIRVSYQAIWIQLELYLWEYHGKIAWVGKTFISHSWEELVSRWVVWLYWCVVERQSSYRLIRSVGWDADAQKPTTPVNILTLNLSPIIVHVWNGTASFDLVEHQFASSQNELTLLQELPWSGVSASWRMGKWSWPDPVVASKERNVKEKKFQQYHASDRNVPRRDIESTQN